ncbi:MAG: hypothetical protein WBQ37_08585 [Candidatus Competibacter sp.]
MDASSTRAIFKNADGRLKIFDLVVTNFPFSIFSNKAWGNGIHPTKDFQSRKAIYPVA